MDLNIIEKQNDVIYEIPKIQFPAYEEYKEKAQIVANYISSMTVTPETVKDVKKDLAKARKLVDRLTQSRIDMKKDILSGFNVYESQVKEITGIVDAADKELRGKVKELEEVDRQKKQQEIRELWNKRIQPYKETIDLLPDAFDKWITPGHLNKSTSMKSIEADMAAWIDKTIKEINTVSDMGKDYLIEYITTYDITKAINNVRERALLLETIKNTEESKEPVSYFIVTGTKDISLTERLLKENEINFKRKDNN